MTSPALLTLGKYRYEPLRSHDSIRLVKLHAGNAEASDIDCDLIEVETSQQGSEKYEAVSWCWGREKWDKLIRIHRGEEVFSFKISPNLYSALKAFRKTGVKRALWIDAISIDQGNVIEKNHQVPMMAKIYGEATSVCVWLGPGDVDSKLALDFIRDDVLKLWDFDRLCDNASAAPKWKALIGLMKQPWFSRRWVVQEIALANEAVLQCGAETIAWKDFADAVALFVEVETATHRLSEVMQMDPAFYHIPDFFGDVRSLGATLLVEATSNLFRIDRDGKREALLSLEYLVSSLSVFEATEPRDTIFALLAIAKDTSPTAADEEELVGTSPSFHQHLKAWGQRRSLIQPYSVDYERPFVDICKDFIVFSIRKSEPSTALDILCRPWVPQTKPNKNESVEPLPSWIPSLDGAAFVMSQRFSAGQVMRRVNADPLVGMPGTGQRNYGAAGSRGVTHAALKFKRRQKYYSMSVDGFELDKVGSVGEPSRAGLIPNDWLAWGAWEPNKGPPPEDFWRTLIADRGPDGRNPPTFYPRACHESFKRRDLGEPLNTQELINQGRCTIVAQFLRRVQAVVWNRRLMITESGRLGLVPQTAESGYLICILYGCSVPMVLKKHPKNDLQLEHERAEDEREFQRSRLDAVTKIQRAYRKRQERQRVRLERSRARSRNWAMARHAAVVGFAVYLDIWASFNQRSVALLLFFIAATFLSIFPHILIKRVEHLWARLVKEWQIWRKRKPKSAGVDGKGPEEYYYELIGPCYVHGMMNGEAISYQNEKEIKPMVFELR